MYISRILLQCLKRSRSFIQVVFVMHIVVCLLIFTYMSISIQLQTAPCDGCAVRIHQQRTFSNNTQLNDSKDILADFDLNQSDTKYRTSTSWTFSTTQIPRNRTSSSNRNAFAITSKLNQLFLQRHKINNGESEHHRYNNESTDSYSTLLKTKFNGLTENQFCVPLPMCPNRDTKGQTTTGLKEDGSRYDASATSFDHSSNGSQKLLTLFTSWSPDVAKRQIHRNTIRNWAQLLSNRIGKNYDKTYVDEIRIILYIDLVDDNIDDNNESSIINNDKDKSEDIAAEEEVVELARRLGWIIRACPRKSDSGIPILKEMFLDARTFSDSYFYAYSNGDIMFAKNLLETLMYMRVRITTGDDFSADSKMLKFARNSSNGDKPIDIHARVTASTDSTVGVGLTHEPGYLTQSSNVTFTNKFVNHNNINDKPQTEHHNFVKTGKTRLKVESFAQKGILIIGRRNNLNVSTNNSFEVKNNNGILNISNIDKLLSSGSPLLVNGMTLFSPYAIDYFITTKYGYPWADIPDFVIGRPAYDNWLVTNAVMRGMAVVDATETILAIHQTDLEGNFAGHKHNQNSSNDLRDYNVKLAQREILGSRKRRFQFDVGRTNCANYRTINVKHSSMRLPLNRVVKNKIKESPIALVKKSMVAACRASYRRFMKSLCCESNTFQFPKLKPRRQQISSNQTVLGVWQPHPWKLITQKPRKMLPPRWNHMRRV